MVSNRIYVKGHAQSLDLVAYLVAYGLDTDMKNDARGSYFTVRTPSHWSPGRTRVFRSGLQNLVKEKPSAAR